MNLRLFFLTFLIESLLIVGGFFGIGILMFCYFGSGAGAESDKAITTENFALIILILLPLIFGVFKFLTVKEKPKAKSYLYASLLVTIVSGIYLGRCIY